MEFRILGSLEVWDDGRPLRVGGPKQRALLALLLLEANEVVSTDRLVDELWGERPPPTAQKIVQNYVSQLRRELGNGNEGRLATRPGGYAVRVGDGELDLDAFERFARGARAARDANDLPAASAALAEGLALWRGAPLRDLDFSPGIRTESARLDERRLAVLEERIALDLDLGRHQDLVGELEALVTRHPLREQLRAQLMLALYRCGRQAEALEAYREGRALLVEELGLEPGEELQRLEQAILRHDPALELPAAEEETGARDDAAPPPDSGRAAWRRAALVAIPAVVLSGAALAAVLAVPGGHEPEPVAANSAASISVQDGRVAAAIPVGDRPTSVAVGAGAVWTLNADDQTISRIDLSTHQVRSIGIGAIPKDIAIGAGAVWVGSQRSSERPSTMTTLLRLEPSSGAVTRRIELPRIGPVVTGFGESAGGSVIGVARNAVWVVDPDLTVSRIDPATGKVATVVRGLVANTLTVGDGVVWVVGRDGTVSRIDPRTNRVTAKIAVPAASLAAVAFGAGSVWVSDPAAGAVWRVEPGRPRVTMRTISVDEGSAALAFGHGSLWVVNPVAGTVTRIDPRTNAVVDRIEVGQPALGVAAGDAGVWVTVGDRGAREGEHASTTPASPQAVGVAGPQCGAVFYEGKGAPDALIVSDLPLQGRSRNQALSIVAAIKAVLRSRGFAAGAHTVGYQSCDDSTAQAQSFEYEKCVSNAHLYAQNPAVVAVVGAYNSDCSMLQIPLANAAPGGPLAMVSPSNSAILLTRPSRTASKRDVDKLYPTGVRNFFRVYPADDVQAAGLALAARQLGAQRLVLLRVEGSGYADDIASAFARSARRLRLSVARSRTWGEREQSYAALVRSLRPVKPDAVVLAGWIGANGGQLIRDLRRLLGPSVLLLGTDGFTQGDEVLRAAGPAAEGMRSSIPGLPSDRLGPSGRAFVERFEAAAPAWLAPNYYWAPFAGQATEVLLDAIAASDGSRRSVVQRLHAADPKGSVLGAMRFDRNGDPKAVMPVTILRIHRGGGGMTQGAPDFANGAVVDRVLRPPRALYRP